MTLPFRAEATAFPVLMAIVLALVACCSAERVGVVSYSTMFVSGAGADDTATCLESAPCATLEYAYNTARNTMVGDLSHKGVELRLLGPGGVAGALGPSYEGITTYVDVSLKVLGTLDEAQFWDTYTYRVGVSTYYTVRFQFPTVDDYQSLDIEFSDLRVVSSYIYPNNFRQGISVSSTPGKYHNMVVNNVTFYGSSMAAITISNTKLALRDVSFRTVLNPDSSLHYFREYNNVVGGLIVLNDECEVEGSAIGVYDIHGGGQFLHQVGSSVNIEMSNIFFQDCVIAFLLSSKAGLSADISGLTASNLQDSFLVDSLFNANLRFHDVTLYGSECTSACFYISGGNIDITNIKLDTWKSGIMFKTYGNSVTDISNLYMTDSLESNFSNFINPHDTATVFLRNSVIQGHFNSIGSVAGSSRLYIDNTIVRDVVAESSLNAPAYLFYHSTLNAGSYTKITNSVFNNVRAYNMFSAYGSPFYRIELADVTIANTGSTPIGNAKMLVSGYLHLCNTWDQKTDYVIESDFAVAGNFYSDAFTTSSHIRQTEECPCSAPAVTTCAACSALNDFPGRPLCGWDHYSSSCMLGESVDSATEILYPTFAYAPGERRFPDPKIGKPAADQWTWPPAECILADTTGVTCATHIACDTCGADTNCGWCASTQRCMPGNAGGPTSTTCPAAFPICEGGSTSIYCPSTTSWSFSGCDSQCSHAGYVQDGCAALGGASGHLKLIENVAYSWTPVESATTVAPQVAVGSSSIGPFTIPFHFQPTDNVWPHFYLSELGFISLERDSRKYDAISSHTFATINRPDILAFFFTDGNLFGDDSHMKVMTGGVAPNRWLVVEFENFNYHDVESAASVQLKLSEDPSLPISIHVKTFDAFDLVGLRVADRDSFNEITIGFYEASASGGVTFNTALYQSLPQSHGERDEFHIPGEYAVGFSRCGMQSSLTEFKTAAACTEVHSLCGTLHLGKCKKCLTGFC